MQGNCSLFMSMQQCIGNEIAEQPHLRTEARMLYSGRSAPVGNKPKADTGFEHRMRQRPIELRSVKKRLIAPIDNNRCVSKKVNAFFCCNGGVNLVRNSF